VLGGGGVLKGLPVRGGYRDLAWEAGGGWWVWGPGSRGVRGGEVDGGEGWGKSWLGG